MAPDREAPAVYGDLAAGYAESNHRDDARRHYEWPAVRDALPPVDGARVLDAGCGPGHYSALLARDGAEVVGVDASEAMVAEATERHGDAATFLRGDLAGPIDGLDAGSFDLVVCQLTLEHVRDWGPVMAEFARLLDDGGRLVVSTDHPFSTYYVIEHEDPEVGSADAESADYYEVERYTRTWGEGEDAVSVPFYRRPLRAVLDPMFDAGFVLEALVEPTPNVENELLAYFEEHTPRFLVLRARLA